MGDRRRDRATPRSVIIELGSESTVHGLPKIAGSTNRRRRIAWLCFVILGFMTASNHLYIMVTKYLRYPVVETSRVQKDLKAVFPAVTICSLMPIRLQEFAEYRHQHGSDEYKLYRLSKSINYSDYDRGGRYRRLFYSHWVQNLYEQYPIKARAVSYDFDRFIVHCKFDKAPCYAENFTGYFDAKHYYACYTFNHGSSSPNDGLVIRDAGAEHGLSLIIALEDILKPVTKRYNIKSNIEDSLGVRVTIHEPNTVPFPAEQGFDIPPGYTTSVNLKTELHTRLPKPHGDCTVEGLHTAHHYKHTLFSCLKVCKQQIIVGQCGCKTSQYPDLPHTKHLPYCVAYTGWRKFYTEAEKRAEEKYNETFFNNTTGIVENSTEYLEGLRVAIDNCDLPSVPSYDVLKNFYCMVDLLGNLSHNESYVEKCGCHVACSEFHHLKSISQAYWPWSMSQWSLIHRELRNQLQESFRWKVINASNIAYRADSVDMIQKVSRDVRLNLLRLNVYMEDLSVVGFKEEAAYGIADLIADVGGALGLWMGISVLSCLELVELVIQLVGLLIRREKRCDRGIDEVEMIG